MGLLELLPTSKFGFGGAKPVFQTLPVPPASLHDTYSVDGNPIDTRILSSNGNFTLPMPSKLDEGDSSNTNKYKNQVGKKYTDNLPK